MFKTVAKNQGVVASDSDSDWDALLDAHGLAPPPNVAAAAIAQPADAAVAWRARDKRRRRLRKAAKRSMWRDISTPSLCLARHVARACAVTGCGFGPGCEHTSEDHGEELADLVFSCTVGAGRGEVVICTFPRIMGTLCRMWAFLVVVALDVARTLLGVMSLNSRIRWWRLLRFDYANG